MAVKLKEVHCPECNQDVTPGRVVLRFGPGLTSAIDSCPFCNARLPRPPSPPLSERGLAEILLYHGSRAAIQVLIGKGLKLEDAEARVNVIHERMADGCFLSDFSSAIIVEGTGT